MCPVPGVWKPFFSQLGLPGPFLRGFTQHPETNEYKYYLVTVYLSSVFIEAYSYRRVAAIIVTDTFWNNLFPGVR